MDKHLFRLDVLGQSLTIQSKEDPAYIAEVADHLKSRLQEVQRETRLAEPLKVALLTALNLVDELFKLKAGQAAPAGESLEIEEITRRMISSIDRSLQGAPLSFPGAGPSEVRFPEGDRSKQ